jgi:folate-binding protein YgfZ
MFSGPLGICRLARERGLSARWDAAPGLGLILVAGPDCADFLQARLTSDVKALAPGQGQLSAKLTGRGELVGYFSLHRLPDMGQPFPSYFLLASRDELARLLEDLVSTRITEDVLLEDVSTQFDAVVVQGPESATYVDRVLEIQASDDLPEYSVRVPERRSSSQASHDLPADILVLSRSFTGDPGRMLLWGAGTSVGGFLERLLSVAKEEGLAVLGVGIADRTAWRWLTVEAGWPVLGRDFEPAKVVLPKTGLEQQVASATKGCYPGQEVVARIRTYGSVPTAMRGLVFGDPDEASLPDLPEPGHDLRMGGHKIGSWGTGAWSVTRDRQIALVFLDRDHRAPGTLLKVKTGAGTLEAEVIMLPFFRAADQGEKARHLHDRAIHLFSGGDDDGAVTHLEEALRLDPGLLDAYEALGVILGRTERYHQAIEIFRRLEEVAPGEPMVHTNLSLYYMKIGDKEEAERQKTQATLKRFSDAGDPLQARAMEEASKAAMAEEARRKIAMFTEVLEIDREDPLALMGIGKAWADLQQYDRADDYLGRARRAQKDNSSLFAAHGKVLEALGRPADAAEVYRQGVAVASRRGDLMPLKDMEHRLLLLQG